LNIVKAMNAKGYAYKGSGDLREAIRVFDEALLIAKRNGFDDYVKFLLNNLALAHTSNASYDKALSYNFESLKIREKEGIPVDIAVALNNIGYLYEELQDLENALVYYERSYQVKIANNVKHDVERSLINIGIINNKLKRFDEAEAKLKEAFNICQTGNCDPEILASAYHALGFAVFEQKEFRASEEYFQKSLALAEKLDLPEFITSDSRMIGTIRFQQGRYDEALTLIDRSQNVSRETHRRKSMLENYLLYARIYAAKGDFKKASEYQNSYIDLYGEIFNADLIKNITRVQTDYEEAENIKIIAEKDQVLELNREVIAQQRKLNLALFAVILLTSALVIVIYRNYRKTRAVNAALATAKRIIEVQNRALDQEVQEKTKELVDTNETLVKVNDELDNFIYKTSHDIRGPLASLKGMVNLAIMDVKDEKALGYLDKLDLTAEKLNTVLTRLLIVNRINHAELKPELIHFEPIIQEILTLEVKKGVPSKIRLEYDVAPDLQLISDKEMVRLILENLIDNALKFYNDSERVESFVRIIVRSEDGRVTAHVRDNGVGISQMDRDKIFQMFVRASERSETGGIGLYLAKLATEKLGGEINLVSTDEKFTEFIVQFPVDLSGIIERRKEEKRRHEQERMQVKQKSTVRSTMS
ncbi:MAG TPA: tetratricopeptide repeat protein, partial [Cyclobacteriaceae bacterium]|nr:tetratricopeptide repeat protein [Cyclobacteriaceae bacterium]